MEAKQCTLLNNQEITEEIKEEIKNTQMLNWATGIDMYTLMCIKLINKNLQYKKTNTKLSLGYLYGNMLI